VPRRHDPSPDLTCSRRTLLGSNRGGTGLSDRYFPVKAMSGRLYFDGREWVANCDEGIADMLVERVCHRKTRTEAELLETVMEPTRGIPALRVWVREGPETSATGLLGVGSSDPTSLRSSTSSTVSY
jgi:hypothetical protein